MKNTQGKNVILSIKPKYVEKILSGEKRYEFRKRIWKKEVDRIFIYASSPMKRIVASFTPGEIIEGGPEELWNRFGDHSGTSKNDFFDYFKGKEKGFAIEIKNQIKFIEPIDPNISNPNFHPPINFTYFLNENIIMKRNQFIPISIDIKCEKTDEGYRITTQSPQDNPTKCPVIKEVGKPFSEHLLLRPFDKFLNRGIPEIGKVTHVFLISKKIPLPAQLCTLIKTRKRILILPSWGKGVMKHFKKGKETDLAPVEHLTIEEKQNGDYRIHITFENSIGGKKNRILNANTLKNKNDNGVHIGTLGVNGVEFLDPLGIIYRNIHKSELPRKKISDVNKILKDSLSKHHPVFILPEYKKWDENHHLEASFAIIGNELKNVDYPKYNIENGDPIEYEQLFQIELDNRISILISIKIKPGKLRENIIWMHDQ